MMKKGFTILLAFVLISTYAIAQTIVGTDPENKNVVLEEFTGMNCYYCPDGHQRAQAIYDAHPDDVVLINIHQGSFATPSGSQPDYRTQWGNPIAAQTGLQGWPSGTVNRHLFSGSNTALDRGQWSSKSEQILTQPSYLNIGAEAIIVSSTRQLVVEVEVYYTGDSPQSSNFLNVAVLQNHIYGPQTNGGAGNNYDHKHMLRYMMTGQWGVEISETTTGSLYSGTFTYELPEDINNVDVELENLEIVAFVSETRQEIISGTMANITTIESNNYDAAILRAFYPQNACSGTMSPTVEIKNYGVMELTSLTFNYEINNGEVLTYDWTGNLLQNEKALVTLPEITYDVETDNTLSIACEQPDGQTDELPQNDHFNTDFSQSQYYPETGYFGVQTLGDPQDITWSIVDENGDAIASGGPYTASGLHLEPFTFPANGCYTLTLNDASGTGLDGGFYIITDEATNVLWTGPGFTDMVTTGLAYDEQVGIDNTTLIESVKIYPNPTENMTQIEFIAPSQDKGRVALYDMLGREIMPLFEGQMQVGENQFELNAAALENGIYFVRIEFNNQTITKKIVVGK